MPNSLIDPYKTFRKCSYTPCLRIHYHPGASTVVIISYKEYKDKYVSLSLEESALLKRLYNSCTSGSTTKIEPWIHTKETDEDKRTFTDFVPDFLLDESTQC